MNKIYITLIITLSLFTFSCKKKEVKPTHEVSFELIFHEKNSPALCYSIWFSSVEIYNRECGCILPLNSDTNYTTNNPGGKRDFDLTEWKYTQYDVEEGNIVVFRTMPTNLASAEWHWSMNVYIDGEVVSHKEVICTEGGSMGGWKIIDEWGWDNPELENEIPGYLNYDPENTKPTIMLVVE